jgi:release factor glutamine methyltransferase
MVEAPKDMPFLADSMKRAKPTKVPCPVCEGAKLMDGCIASDETQHKAPHSPKRILDIGTGSGCIAISLKLRLGDAYVEAWDISEEALRTAQDNADALKAEVVFRKRDALVSSAPTEQAMDSINYSEANILAAPWDLIVSNPPYICDSERSAMDDNVLLHEPHTALFVPDDDPLRFYRAIARYALLTLNIGGSLLFECNIRYAEATGNMLSDMGFEEVTVSDDCFNLPRFVRGSSPSQPSPSGRA